MKYVFFGTPRFAEIILKGLLDAGLAPVALVCNPDRPVGRKKIVTPPLTKQLIEERKAATAILQPETLDEASIRRLKDLRPDCFVVAAYAKIIPHAVLTIPRFGTLGTHPSLLPRYRGASPIQSVILAGEPMTGSTIYQMDAQMDHGAIVAQESISLDALTTDYVNLEKQLAELSVPLLVKTIQRILDGTVTTAIQDESLATFTKKFRTMDGFVDPLLLDAARGGDVEKAEQIVRTINALNPEPGVWTLQNGARVKLLQVHLENSILKISKIQREGETAKTISSF